MWNPARRPGVLLLIAALFIPSIGLTSIEPKLVLTAKLNGLQSDPMFSKTGKIHGYLTLPSKQVGNHILEAIWMKPDGTVQEHTQVKLNILAPGRQTAYVWMSFDGGQGGLLSPVRDEDPMHLSFCGDWNVQIKWDHQPLVKNTFKVQC